MDKHEFDLKMQTRAIVLVAVQNLTKYGMLALMFFFCWKCIDSLAGKTTIATVIGKLALDLKINRIASQTLAWILGGGSSIVMAAQKRLSGKTIRKLRDRNAELEKLIDPKRSSSRLNPEGETSEEDEV
jgi:hypothetical protein